MRPTNPLPPEVLVRQTDLQQFLTDISLHYDVGYRFNFDRADGKPTAPGCFTKLFSRSASFYEVKMFIKG